MQNIKPIAIPNQMTKDYFFNIRVYGLIIRAQEILVSKENIDGFEMTKFPGGGLEFGEGILDGLQRELNEELGSEAEAPELFHVTEQYIESVFAKREQVISIYYLIRNFPEVNQLEIHQETNVGSGNLLKFSWQKIDDMLLKKLTFEMDQEALRKLLAVRIFFK
jgi:ADP-ribose pyrophosphatase YjhB (NUDIX family)